MTLSSDTVGALCSQYIDEWDSPYAILLVKREKLGELVRAAAEAGAAEEREARRGTNATR